MNEISSNKVTKVKYLVLLTGDLGGGGSRPLFGSKVKVRSFHFRDFGEWERQKYFCCCRCEFYNFSKVSTVFSLSERSYGNLENIPRPWPLSFPPPRGSLPPKKENPRPADRCIAMTNANSSCVHSADV